MRLLTVALAAGVVASAFGDGVWDQSDYDLAANCYVDQEFPDFPAYSTYQVHDFTTHGLPWRIKAVSTYFTAGYGDWSGIMEARLNLFPKTGSLPRDGDDPTAGTVVGITKTLIDGGATWKITADSLYWDITGGDYWIGLTPIAELGTYGQEFHRVAQTQLLDFTSLRDPGGGFGFGSGWATYRALGYTEGDGALTVDYFLYPEPTTLLLWSLGAGLALRRR